MAAFPKGVDAPNGYIRIRFTYKGVRCSESLGLPVNKRNLAYADNKLRTIRVEIRERRFEYKNHFPESSRASLFGYTKASGRTVEDGVLNWLAIKKVTVAPSGFRKYSNDAHCHVIPKWGSRQISSISHSELVKWQTIELPTQDLSNKSINCIMTVLRGVFADAKADTIIDHNPLESIKNLPSSPANEPDPLNQEEIQRIVSLDTHRVQEINAIGFNVWTGLRKGELLALAWEDVNLVTGVINVKRSIVDGEYKVPKTVASVREFDLLPEALAFLKRQYNYTSECEPVAINVRQRNNRSFLRERVRFVFHNTNTNEPWVANTSFQKMWVSLLRKAKVRYRGPNHLRHTFISQMLTQYIPPAWIATMCGTSVAMIEKHYGRFIKEDRPNLSAAIARLREKHEIGHKLVTENHDATATH